MAKDDYYVIVAKILIYLYKKYKRISLDNDYIRPLTKDFPISQEQLFDTIDMIMEQEYIKGNVVKAWGGDIISVDYDSLKITPKGIDYLQNNKTIRKVCERLKDAKDLIPFFIELL